MVKAFGGFGTLCPSQPLRQKKRTKWNQAFLRRESGEESEQTAVALSCLKCYYSIAGLWVLFFFPLRKLTSCRSKAELEHMNGF